MRKNGWLTIYGRLQRLSLCLFFIFFFIFTIAVMKDGVFSSVGKFVT
jgi:hypothetical protein